MYLTIQYTHFRHLIPPNHNNIFDGNFYNCPCGISSIGSSASIDNRPFTSDSVPEAAQRIIDHAGIDKEPLENPSSRVNLAFGKPVFSSENDDISPASNAHRRQSINIMGAKHCKQT